MLFRVGGFSAAFGGWFGWFGWFGVAGGDAGDDGGAAEAGGFYFEGSAEEGGAFSHADEAEAALSLGLTAVGAGLVKPDAVVLDHEHDVIFSKLEHDLGLFRLGVLDDIVEGFLGDAVKSDLDLGCKARLSQTCGMKLGRNVIVL